MGIFTYIKIGAALVILGVVGYFVYDYKHMKTVITQQQEKIAGLELRAKIIEKAQAATDAFMKKKAAVQNRLVREKANVDKVVEAGDDAGMRQLFINSGLLGPKASTPASGSPGRPGNIPPRAPRLQPPN
jgi:hypothetical protein